MRISTVFKKNFQKTVLIFFAKTFLLIFFAFSQSYIFSFSDDLKLSHKILKINLIYESNGKGLEAHGKILEEAIQKLGHEVKVIDIRETKRCPADINIFLHIIVSEKLSWAKCNWFIPFPDFFNQDLKFLNKIDLILCSTYETEKIFKKFHKSTYYLGFTSHDCYQPLINKDFLHFLHLAGSSHLKGTTSILQIWQSHPLFPLLTIVRFPSDFVSQQPNLQWIPYRLPVEQVTLLQNQCGIHLCPSEVEGYGHYIMEGMSACAVVLTTNAPPMNEFIQDPRCLVPYSHSAPHALGTCYFVDPVQLENKIASLINLPSAELAAIGLQNRAIYLQKKKEFHDKLDELLGLFSFLND